MPGFNRSASQNSYDEVKQKFQEIYWGDGRSGNVKRETWLLPKPALKRLAKNSELAIFTGRVRQELDYTLDRNALRSFFKTIVTVENVKHGKPDPDGLHIILDGRDPSTAIYLGDNIDDARASQAARVPFIGVLPYRSEARRHRAASLQELGARTILGRRTPARVLASEKQPQLPESHYLLLQSPGISPQSRKLPTD